jgi:hypothetical protein
VPKRKTAREAFAPNRPCDDRNEFHYRQNRFHREVQHPPERLCEIAAILARGVIRWKRRAAWAGAGGVGSTVAFAPVDEAAPVSPSSLPVGQSNYPRLISGLAPTSKSTFDPESAPKPEIRLEVSLETRLSVARTRGFTMREKGDEA